MQTEQSDNKYSEDFSKENTTVKLNGKTYKWLKADCNKHLKLTRTTSTRCALCVESNHISFLESKGVVVIERKNHNTYRVRLSCEHEKDVHPDKHNFSDYCIECRNSKTLARFPVGSKLLEFTQQGQRVNVQFPCGHTSVRHTYSDDVPYCTECRTEEKVNVLREIAAIENPDGSFKLACGHSTGITAWQKLGTYKCRGCENRKLYDKALTFGLKATNHYDSASHRHEFILKCGHAKLLRTSDVKPNVPCEVCGEDHYSKPSDMYLLICFSENLTFLKVGIANNTMDRIKEYKTTEKVNGWMLYTSVGFNSKREAVKIEKALHKELQDRRIDPQFIKDYIKCGFTECYPLSMLNEISDKFCALQKQYDYSVHYRKVT